MGLVKTQMAGTAQGLQKSQEPGFRILAPHGPVSHLGCKATSLVLNQAKLNEIQKANNFPIGCLNPVNSPVKTCRLAYRVSKRLARQFSPEDPREADAFASAWHFTIWMELCSIIPLRHLVKHIIDAANGRRILIPIERDAITCLKFVGKNEVCSFVLARELAKNGQNVFLYIPWRFSKKKTKSKSDALKLRFTASPALWWAEGDARIPNAATKRVLIPDHMRNEEYIRRRVDTDTVLGDSVLPKPEDTFLLRDCSDNPRTLEFTFKREKKAQFYDTFVATEPFPTLVEGFLAMMGETSKSAWQKAKEAVRNTGATEAHVCDLLMFDSALMAHAVADSGGKWHLWPHSTNAVIMPYHQKNRIAKSVAVTKYAKTNWETILDTKDIEIDSGIMLDKPALEHRFKKSEPLNVICFAAPTATVRMPACDMRAHEASIRKLYSRLNELPENFNLLIKPKHSWETEISIKKLLPKKHRFAFTDETTAELNLPNMIFITTTFGSSALIEGMCKGVPGYVARETPVADYTALSEERAQVGTVDFVIEQILACSEEDHYASVADQNIEWIRSETVF